MSASNALRMFVLATTCASAAWSAEGPPACSPGAMSVQIDQLYQTSASVAIARTEMMPQGRPEYGPFRGAHGGMRTSRVTRRLHGEARAIVPLALAGRAVAGAASMVMQANEHVTHGSHRAARSALSMSPGSSRVRSRINARSNLLSFANGQVALTSGRAPSAFSAGLKKSIPLSPKAGRYPSRPNPALRQSVRWEISRPKMSAR